MDASPQDRSYRPDVDGLRAIAVLLVVLYHLRTAKCIGGFIGVDVFFVISGYLLSSLILADLKAGRFSLVEFYGAANPAHLSSPAGLAFGRCTHRLHLPVARGTQAFRRILARSHFLSF
jgi:hypothetical protein